MKTIEIDDDDTLQNKHVRVIVCRVGYEPDECVVIDTLAAFQEIVGGGIDATEVGDGLWVTYNDTGALDGLPANRTTPAGTIHGNFIVTRVSQKGNTRATRRGDMHSVLMWPKA